MFSATWPTDIQRLASEFLSDPVKITIGSQDLSASHSVSQARHTKPTTEALIIVHDASVSGLSRARRGTSVVNGDGPPHLDSDLNAETTADGGGDQPA